MHLRKLLKNINLQFQKLDTMLINDLKLFFRDKKSLILVALTPFLILAILINLFYFSDVSENIRGVSLAVCDLDGQGLDLESEIFEVTVFSNNCTNFVAEEVTNGKFRGAIVIPKNFQQDIRDGKGTELLLFVDNSKQTTAVVTTNAMKAYVSDLNEQIGTRFILEAWENLNELNENLRFLVRNLNKATPVAKELQVRLRQIRSELDTVDFKESDQTISDIIKYLDLLELQLSYVNDSFTAPTLPEIPKVDYSPSAQILIKEYRLSSSVWRSSFCTNLTLSDPTCKILNYADDLIIELDNQTAVLNSYQATINNRIVELNQKSDEIDATLYRLDSLLKDGSEDNKRVRQDIQKLRESLLFLEDKTENITESIDELDASMTKFLSDIVQVTDDLNKTITVLDTYTQKDPSTILRPVKVDARSVFKDKLEIFYRLPALISIILLFITLFISSSLIVNERRGGTMARIFLSPISMFFYVFEKLIYLLLLCIISVISMLLATLLFGVFTTINLEVILVFLTASLVYISLGMLIGSISKSENTSLLTCLVIGFPLMFMSGAFNPPELMDKFMRVASTYLPLTLNISLLENLTIYHTGIDAGRLLILFCMIAVFYLLTVLMIRRQPTLK